MAQRVFSFILCLVLAAAPLRGMARAQVAPDLSREGSISFTLGADAVAGRTDGAVTFRLYRVADVTRTAGTGGAADTFQYALTADFAGSGVVLGSLTDEGLADALAGFAGDSGAVPMSEQRPDGDGRVAFSDLQVGLYLVAQEGELNGYYPVEPFVVSVPLEDAGDGGWIYDVDARPKLALRAVPPDPPPEPPVDPVDPPDPPATEQPTEQPTPPATEPPVEPTPPPGADDGLIQTGQLNWPIPVLAVAGILLFAAGWVLFFGKEKRDDET